jgi:serine/threonine protein kinase
MLARVSVCLGDNLAAEFAGGALGSKAAAAVEVHLAQCRDCRRLVAALAGALGQPGDPGHDSELATAPRATRPVTSERLGDEAFEFSVGDRIGRYLVIGRLGAGGMGVVLSAYDPQLDRRVAIKLLRSGSGITSAEGRARLIREAKAIAQLSHPHVVAVYDVGTVDATSPDDLYIAMELVEGDTLTQWLQRWPRPWRQVLDVMIQAGRGLAAAHAVGLLHRDFKPDNVMVGTDGRVRVGDFGLARSVVGPEFSGADASGAVAAALHGSLTASGTVLGTPRFMAPEQIRGDHTDARSDQFSYCVALYDAIYGAHPLDGENAVGMVDRGERARPPPDATKVPAAIGRAILRGLEAQPSKRFPSMDALLAELAIAPARPRRVVAVAAMAVAVAGAAAAAVVARPTETPAVTAGIEGDLLQQIEAIRAERDQLLDRLRVRVASQQQLDDLRAEVSRKNDEIQQLITALDETRAELRDARRPIAATGRGGAGDAPGRPPRPVAPTDALLAAFRDLTSDLTGCFEEWAARYPAPAASLDTSLNVEISVSPEGRGTATRSTGQGSLPICVRDVLTRVSYPATGNLVRLVVAVRYRGGAVVVEPKVQNVTPKGQLIDLRP